MLANDQVLNKGRYRIVGNFGHKGAGGGIYEAFDTVSNTNVVLRETVGNNGVATSLSEMDAINDAFLDRAKTLSQIRHKSLVCVQDFFADIDRQYLVLEPVAGIELSTVMTTGAERPDVADVLSWADQLLDALQFLHSQKTPIVHGDINPDNVKLAPDSTVKLVISSDHSVAGENSINIASVRPDGEAGVNYRPLEQLWVGLDALSQRVILNSYDEGAEKGLLQPLSPASDIYSFGATIYAALTGLVPPDALDRSIAALEGKPDPLQNPSSVNGNVPPEIAEVILKAMSLKREDRHYSVVILRQVLRTAAVKVKEREAGIVDDAPVQKAATPVPTAPKQPTPPVPAPRTEEPKPIFAEPYPGPERRRIEHAKPAALATDDDVLGLLDLPSEPVAPRPAAAADTHTSQPPAKAEMKTHISEPPAAPQVSEAPPAPVTPEVAQSVVVETVSPVQTVVEKKVEEKTAATSAFVSNFETDHASTPPNRMIMIAGGAVLAVIAVIAIYMFAFSGSSTPPPANATTQSAVPEPVQQSVPEQTAPEQTETLNVAAPSPENQSDTSSKTAKPNQPNATKEAPKKQPTPAPAAAKTPKKVTMDDLLN